MKIISWNNIGDVLQAINTPTKQEKFLEFQSKFFYEMDNFFEHQLFQDYLQEIFWADYCWLDDDMPDAFDTWQVDIWRTQMLGYFTDFITQ